MLIVSDRIQIPSKTTHKDKGTKVNTFYYFISKYSIQVPRADIAFFFIKGYKCNKLSVITPKSNLCWW